MKAASKIGFLPLFLVVLVFSSCLKKKEFPLEPQITFGSFVVHDDGLGADLTVNFTDGDGDIGLEDFDTVAPYNLGSEYYYNMYLDYYELINGEWVLRELNPPFAYRVPSITPSGQNKALEGEISVDLSPIYYDPTGADTIKFMVRIIDRALNVSNEVESDIIITP